VTATTRPTTRQEAIALILRDHPHYFAALYALALAFPLPGEAESARTILSRLDPLDREYIERVAKEILAQWGLSSADGSPNDQKGGST
jgi:hypothetical protein